MNKNNTAFQFFSTLLIISLTISLVIASDPTQTPVLAPEFHTSVLISNLQGSASPSPINYAGQFYYKAQAGSNPSSGLLSYDLRDFSIGASTARIVVESFSNQVQFFQGNGMTGACSNWTVAAPSPSGSLAQLTYPSLNFWLSPTFLVDNSFTYIGVEYYRRGLIYFGTWHYKFSNQFVQFDYFHSIDYNIPFRLTIGWNPSTYYQSWNPIIVEFQTDFFLGLNDVSASQLNYVFSNTGACSGAPSGPKPPAKSTPPTPPVAAIWPVQWNAQTSFTGNDFGTLTTSEAKIQLVGHFYYDHVGNRECNFWEDVTSGEKTKTLIVDGQFHAITFSTGACVEPPVPIHESLHNNWTQNLPFYDNRWLLRQTIHPDTGDFWLNAQHYAWDAFGAGAEHAFQYNQLPTGEPLQFQGPVYDFPPYLQSFSSWSGFTVGLTGLNLTTIYGVGDNCVKIGGAAWDFILSSEAPHYLALGLPLPQEVAEIHQQFNLLQLRKVFFASLMSVRARTILTHLERK